MIKFGHGAGDIGNEPRDNQGDEHYLYRLFDNQRSHAENKAKDKYEETISVRLQFDEFIQFVRKLRLLLPGRDSKNDVENDADHDMREDGNQGQDEDEGAPIAKGFR